MIMEGLETLVAPSHHAFLLTESAAAAHFNVLSFDTCLLKTAATSASLTTNNNNLFTANNNHTINHHHHQQQQQQHQHQHHQHQHHHQTSNSQNHQTTTGGNQQQHQHNSNHLNNQTQTHHHQTLTSNSATTTHPHLNLLHSLGTGNISEQSRTVAEHNTTTEIQTGDLNTPVTTASDIPSFFGPSTVVEPPPITGMYILNAITCRLKQKFLPLFSSFFLYSYFHLMLLFGQQ